MSAPPATWEWVGPNGNVRNLMNDQPRMRPGGIIGHLSPPVALYDSLPPSMDGGLYQGHQYKPRTVGLGLTTYGLDPLDRRDMFRQLDADFNTTAGEGRLTVIHADADTRHLYCRYVNGLGGDGGTGVRTLSDIDIELRAYDPWWYGSEVQRVFTVSAGATPLYPGPPFTISTSSLVNTDATVKNNGDVPAYPRWIIEGPMTAVTLSGGGQTLTVTATLLAGERIYIDTNPRVAAQDKIVDDAGDNQWGIATSSYPNLWALPQGSTTINVAMAGSTSASSVTMLFSPRYRTA